MKRESRSSSYRKSRRRRSHSRSREKKPSNHNRSRDYEILKIKKESDIKNHFIFKIKTLSEKEETDAISILKQKLTECIGPVEHITRTRERHDKMTTLNLGFKYDIDAISYLQGDMTIKTSSENIRLVPQPTEVFEMVLAKNYNQKRVRKEYRKSEVSSSKSSPKKRSSSDKSRRKPKKSKPEELKLQIFGIPSYVSSYKVVSSLRELQGGPFECLDPVWKSVADSSAEYFEFYISYEKGKKLLEQAYKLQMEGRPVLLVEAKQGNPSRQLQKYQLILKFPKLVHPGTLLKNLNCSIVQLLAYQKPQKDGRCSSYHLTLSDSKEVYQLQRMGKLSSGVAVEVPREEVLVYRPVGPWMMPPRSQWG